MSELRHDPLSKRWVIIADERSRRPEDFANVADLLERIGASAFAGDELAEILVRRVDGNRVYFRANPDCPFLQELQGLLIKTVGVAETVREALAPLAAGITWACLYGSVARAEELATSDVDLLVVGTVGLADLAPALRRAEQRLGRTVNPTVYSEEECRTKLATGDHFLTAVLDGTTLSLLGDRHELAAPSA